LLDGRKKLLFLFLFALIVFAPYFYRADIQGVDSYYFAIGLGVSLLSIKIYLFGAFLFSVLAIAGLGHLFNKEEGWKAGIFAVGLGPMLLWELTKFENDAFGYMFAFAGLYMLYIWKLKGDRLALGAAFLNLLAASLVWKGALFYLIAFAGVSFWFVPFAAVATIGFFPEVLVHLNPFIVQAFENLPLIGVAWLGLLVLGVFGVRKNTLIPMAVLLGVALLNSKFTLLVVPFLAVGVVGFLENKKPWFKEYIFNAAVVLGVVWGLLLIGLPPTASDWGALDYGVEYAEENCLEFKPYWDFGYWSAWKGYPAPYYGGEQPQDFKGAVTVTTLGLQDCNLLKTFKDVNVFEC
jgi:hypothetical protein